MIYPADYYTSLYQTPQNFNVDGTTQTRIGFKNQYNVDDPVIRCHSVNNSCPVLQNTELGMSAFKESLKIFKVFIAPGTISANLLVFLTQPALYEFVARLGMPPQKEYSDSSEDAYNNLPFSGFSISQLKQGDCVGRNASGITTILSNGYETSESGWLYVQLIPRSGGIQTTQYSNAVTTDTFMKWFRTVKWLSNGDPTDTTTSSTGSTGSTGGTGTTPVPTTTGTGLTGDPNPLDFKQTSISSTNNILKFILRNIASTDITINSITFPDGFTWKFTDEYPAYQPYDFKSIYQSGYDGKKGFIDIIIKSKKYYFSDRILNDDRSNFLVKAYVPPGAFSFKCNINVGDAGVKQTLAIASFGKPPKQFYKDETTGLYENMFSNEKSDTTFNDLENKILIPDSNGDIQIVSNYFDENDYSRLESNRTQYSGKWLYIIVVSKSGYLNYTWIEHQMSDVKVLEAIKTTGWRTDGDPWDVFLTSTVTAPRSSSKYENMCVEYYRAPENSGEFSFPLLPEIASAHSKYQKYARIFIPPGTIFFQNSYGKSVMAESSIARFLQPPESDNFLKVSCIAWATPEDRKNNKSISCDEFSKLYGRYVTDPNTGQLVYEAARSNMGGGFETSLSSEDLKRMTQNVSTFEKCKTDLFTYNKNGADWVHTRINLTTPLPLSQAGWFFVKMDGPLLEEGSTYETRHQHTNSTTILIDSEIYNQWWDNYGSNSDHSIDFVKDVESSEIYKPIAISHTPKVKPGPSVVNPTPYKTIHNPYYRLPNNTGRVFTPEKPGKASFYSPAYATVNFYARDEYFSTDDKNVRGKTTVPKLVRMFIPPGTSSIKIYSLRDISQATLPTVVSRHKTPPTTNYDGSQSRDFKLNDLTAHDCYGKEIIDSNEIGYTKPNIYKDYNGGTWICNDIYTIGESYLEKGLTVDNAGWLYAKTDKFTNIHFEIVVEIPIFNAWWDSYGTNKDKSINWDIDVEQLQTYPKEKLG